MGKRLVPSAPVVVDGDSLSGVIWRLADLAGLRPMRLLDICRWPDDDSPDYSILTVDLLPPSERGVLILSDATGIPAESLRATSLSRFADRLSFVRAACRDAEVGASRDGRERATSALRDHWIHLGDRPVCLECLAERPGGLKLTWMVGVLPVCLKHSVLLSNRCPGCGDPISTRVHLFRSNSLPPRDPSELCPCGVAVTDAARFARTASSEVMHAAAALMDGSVTDWDAVRGWTIALLDSTPSRSARAAGWVRMVPGERVTRKRQPPPPDVIAEMLPAAVRLARLYEDNATLGWVRRGLGISAGAYRARATLAISTPVDAPSWWDDLLVGSTSRRRRDPVNLDEMPGVWPTALLTSKATDVLWDCCSASDPNKELTLLRARRVLAVLASSQRTGLPLMEVAYRSDAGPSTVRACRRVIDGAEASGNESDLVLAIRSLWDTVEQHSISFTERRDDLRSIESWVRHVSDQGRSGDAARVWLLEEYAGQAASPRGWNRARLSAARTAAAIEPFLQEWIEFASSVETVMGESA